MVLGVAALADVRRLVRSGPESTRAAPEGAARSLCFP
jgi:hypothetical protein